MSGSAKSVKRWGVGLGALQLFIGIGAVLGGIALVSDPSGGNLGIPLEALRNSPFSNYLIPGIVLLGVNGLGSCAGGFLSIFRRRFAVELGAALGLFLMAWIGLQVYWLGFPPHWLQILYFGLGVAELALALRLRMALRRAGL
ncbi:MAG: hypothetical protein GY856_41000 [bacterium]|nr:hypothetical protein [bacterium]